MTRPLQEISAVTIAFAVLAGAGPARAEEVGFEVPLPSRLDLAGRQSVAVAGVDLVAGEGETALRDGRELAAELARRLEGIFRRHTALRVVEMAGPPPAGTLRAGLESGGDRDLWRALGEASGADLIVVASLDFDFEDASGYRTEAYDVDGRTLYRQVLVEQASLAFDLLLVVFDGVTGERLHDENLRGGHPLPSARVDPAAELASAFAPFEERIAGLFAARAVRTKRSLAR